LFAIFLSANLTIDSDLLQQASLTFLVSRPGPPILASILVSLPGLLLRTEKSVCVFRREEAEMHTLSNICNNRNPVKGDAGDIKFQRKTHEARHRIV
jgi:hypothetical protein